MFNFKYICILFLKKATTINCATHAKTYVKFGKIIVFEEIKERGKFTHFWLTVLNKDGVYELETLSVN